MFSPIAHCLQSAHTLRSAPTFPSHSSGLAMYWPIAHDERQSVHVTVSCVERPEQLPAPYCPTVRRPPAEHWAPQATHCPGS